MSDLTKQLLEAPPHILYGAAREAVAEIERLEKLRYDLVTEQTFWESTNTILNFRNDALEAVVEAARKENKQHRLPLVEKALKKLDKR